MKRLSLILLFCSSPALASAPQSFALLLTGKTVSGPHPNEEAAVRKVVAGFVENLKVKKYVLGARPANGGFRACIEPVKDGGYDYIVGELNTFAIRESVWQISLVANCPAGQ